MMTPRGIMLALLTCAMMSSAGAYAFAPRDAGAKMSGDIGTGFWATKSSGRHIDHASNYARDMQAYSSQAKTIDPQIAKTNSETLGQAIINAKKDLEIVRKEAAGDKEVIARVDAIQGHLDTALKHHQEMHMECSKMQIDSASTMSCCNDVIKAIDAAAAEHKLLLSKIAPQQPQGGTPAKTGN